MATTIEHYSKFTNYVIDVELEDVLYNVYIGNPLGDTDAVDVVINVETAENIDSKDPLYAALIAAAQEEISARETTDNDGLIEKLQQLSDPLIVRDAEELQEALTAINELVKNR
jgi:hypothetical protein